MWELFDIKHDPKELKNLASNPAYSQVLVYLQDKLRTWQNTTADPWICSPEGVLEDSGAYKYNPTCMPLYNNLT